MYILAIAAFGYGETASKFRLIDGDSMETLDVPIWKIKKALKNNLLKIENMELVGDKLKGISGTLKKLPELDEDGDTNRIQSFTILYRIANSNGYLISDCTGKVSCVTINELAGYYLAYGITNGKLMSNNNRYLVLPIKENYPDFTVDERTRQLLHNRAESANRLNAKLGLMNYPYRILGKTLEIIKKDFESINIVEPVEFIQDNIFSGCDVVSEITLPPSLKKINSGMFVYNARLKKLNISRKTEVTDFFYNYAWCTKIINYYD